MADKKLKEPGWPKERDKEDTTRQTKGRRTRMVRKKTDNRKTIDRQKAKSQDGQRSETKRHKKIDKMAENRDKEKKNTVNRQTKS